jgi:hypothetical protein
MRNQTIKNAAPALDGENLELGRPLDANGNPLSPDEIEEIWAQQETQLLEQAEKLRELSPEEIEALTTEEQRRYQWRPALAMMAPRFTHLEWTEWQKQIEASNEQKAFDELMGQITCEFNARQARFLKAQFEQLSRRGQMSREEWSAPISVFDGCEAILCELAPDFDLKSTKNWGEYQTVTAQVIKQTIASATHPKAEALRQAFELGTAEREKVGNRAFWPVLAHCDEVLGATEKWRISVLEKANFDQERPQGYSLREYMAFVEEKRRSQTRAKLPKTLPQPTFIEARKVCESLSDGRDGRQWEPIEGVIALLHSAPKSTHSVRFEPSARLLKWWGTQGAQIETLRAELARLDLDDVILFRVVLSAILHNEKAYFSASLDDIIKLIGRDGDARKSTAAREKWRAKVWRSLVLFDSLAVVGTRDGFWREPGAKGSKRGLMDAEALYSNSPLLLISGTRDTEQGTFDGSAPPKRVSLVPGDWLMPFHGNREVLSEFGDVLPIAQIPRGTPSGAWAACAGLMLCQIWREQATRATVERNSRGKETKIEVLKFRPFTRRELLASSIRSDYDVNEILDDPKSGHRARDYWKAAIKELKTRGVIGYYAELPSKPASDWREEWLDQPLDIRPAGEMLTDALTIHKDAQTAKKRGTRKRALPKASETKSDG